MDCCMDPNYRNDLLKVSATSVFTLAIQLTPYNGLLSDDLENVKHFQCWGKYVRVFMRVFAVCYWQPDVIDPLDEVHSQIGYHLIDNFKRNNFGKRYFMFIPFSFKKKKKNVKSGQQEPPK